MVCVYVFCGTFDTFLSVGRCLLSVVCARVCVLRNIGYIHLCMTMSTKCGMCVCVLWNSRYIHLCMKKSTQCGMCVCVLWNI